MLDLCWKTSHGLYSQMPRYLRALRRPRRDSLLSVRSVSNSGRPAVDLTRRGRKVVLVTFDWEADHLGAGQWKGSSGLTGSALTRRLALFKSEEA